MSDDFTIHKTKNPHHEPQTGDQLGAAFQVWDGRQDCVARYYKIEGGIKIEVYDKALEQMLIAVMEKYYEQIRNGEIQ